MTVALTGGPILTAVEVDAYRLAAGSLVYTLPHGTGPHGALSMEGAPRCGAADEERAGGYGARAD